MTEHAVSGTDDPAARGARSGRRALGEVLEGVLVVVIGVGLLVYVPNALTTKLTGVSRSARVALASTWFFVALFAYAFALRRRQRQRRGA